MATITRAIYAYLFLLVVLRLIGRRAVMQSSPFELILIFLFGGTMIQAVVGEDRSLVNASLAVMTIGLMHVIVAYIKDRWIPVRKLTEGTPIPLRWDNEWDFAALRRSRLAVDDVMAVAREQGITDEGQIRYAIFERSGKINIVPAH